MRSCSMDLTLSKPLTLDNVKASFPLYSLNRGFGGITPEYDFMKAYFKTQIVDD